MYQEQEDDILPFHRKYRSQSFAEYIGNESMKRALLTTLNGKVKPQVLFYYGPAGCGKTTLARLTMMEYLCHNRDPDRGACGVCPSCVQMIEYIETGKGDYNPNIREIDAAAAGGKADIDALLDEASVPAYGEEDWKIFMLDECHKLTEAAQNRLLKTLEEPSPRVLMILCTTDPDKMLKAVLTRCQLKFEVSKPKRNEMVPLLERVCKEEGIKYDKRALSLICVKGEFVPRQSLILLENVATQAKEATYDKAVQVLEVISESHYFDFFRYAAADHIDPYRFISFLGRLKMEIRLPDFVSGLLDFTQRGIYVVNGADVEALDESEIKQYKKLFSNFDVRMIAAIIDRILKLKYSKDVEAELMLMAYTGLFPKNQQSPIDVTPVTLLDDTQNAEDVLNEKKIGRENHIESITPTEEQKNEFIKQQSAPVGFSDLGKIFGKDVIVGPVADVPKNK